MKIQPDNKTELFQAIIIDYSDQPSDPVIFTLPCPDSYAKDLQNRMGDDADIYVKNRPDSLNLFVPIMKTIPQWNMVAQKLTTIVPDQIEKVKAILEAESPDTAEETCAILDQFHTYEYMQDASTVQQDGFVKTSVGYVKKTEGMIETPSDLHSIRFFSPITGTLYRDDPDCPYFVQDGDYLEAFELYDYADEINAHIKQHYPLGAKGLAKFLTDNILLTNRLVSAHPSVEQWHGMLWGVMEVKYKGSLTPIQMEEVEEGITGQYSDGWGESFEQDGLTLCEGKLEVHFWQPLDAFSIQTEAELKGLDLNELQEPEMSM